MEYDDRIVRQLLKCVVVDSKEQITVIFKGGLKSVQPLTKWQRLTAAPNLESSRFFVRGQILPPKRRKNLFYSPTTNKVRTNTYFFSGGFAVKCSLWSATEKRRLGSDSETALFCYLHIRFLLFLLLQWLQKGTGGYTNSLFPLHCPPLCNRGRFFSQC